VNGTSEEASDVPFRLVTAIVQPDLARDTDSGIPFLLSLLPASGTRTTSAFGSGSPTPRAP